MKVLIFGVAIFAVFLAVLILSRTKVMYAKPPAPGVIPPNSVFHKPVGANCPTGTKLMPRYFSEKDGTTLDACFNPMGDGSIDYINPGEGCTIGIHVEPDEKPEKPKA